MVKEPFALFLKLMSDKVDFDYSKNEIIELIELYKKLYGVGGSGIVITKPISKDIVIDDAQK